MSFDARPVIYCDKCPSALRYELVSFEQPNHILIHDNSECERSGQRFKAPSFELEQIISEVSR